MNHFCILKIVLLLFTISISVTSSDDDVPGYYWRDYKGVLPSDAFEAAPPGINQQLYFGQVLFRDQLIPARIEPFDQQVFYEWAHIEFTLRNRQNVKIFCTLHPEQLQWVTTGNDSFQHVLSKVEAGYEPDFPLYIGRTFLDNEFILGKIIPTEGYTRMVTSKNGKVVEHAKFDVLIYNPNIKKGTKNSARSNSIQPTTNKQNKS